MTQLSALIQGSGKNAIDQRSYIATAGQTAFAVTYAPPYVEVYQNGVRLNVTDYTATSGTSVVLTVGAAVGDEIELVGFISDASIIAATNLASQVTGVLPAANGGTGVTTFTGTGNAVLSVGPTITLANATGLPLTTGVTGILPAANGGTSLSSPGASGNVLTSNGTTWTSATPSGGSPRISTTVTATSGIITPVSTATDQYNITALAGAATFAVPSGSPVDAQKLMLRIKDNGTARALAWTTTPGGYRVIGNTLPTTTVIAIVTAGAFVVGQIYTILTVGTTVFTAVGASANTVGVVFTATGIGSGTGTVGVGQVTYIGLIYNSQDAYWDVVAVGQQ